MRLLVRTVALSVLVGVLAGASTPLALLVEVEPLGRGSTGTVVGVVIQVAPVDRDRLGERARVTLSLHQGETAVDRHSAVVEMEDDGSAILYREWPVGTYELHVGVASVEGTAEGGWAGPVSVTESDEPFIAPEDATPDAVALELTPPREGGVTFLPPPDLGGIGALQLEVEAPEATAAVEFYHDGSMVGRRNRPPWTVSVPLGEIIRRTTVTAVALDAKGRYLGEDAIVLNNPTGELAVSILLAPAGASPPGMQTVTVSVTGGDDLHEVTLHADEEPLARWAQCPCVVDVPNAELARASILAAEAVDVQGLRGDAIWSLAGGGGFSGFVEVELVELAVVVLDQSGRPVVDVDQSQFRVLEDGEEVALEGFGTTAELPLSLAIAVDTSGSMTDTFPQVRKAVNGFVDTLLEPDDEATLLTFSWDAIVRIGWTDDIPALKTRLDRVIPEGGTSLHDAVVRSLEQFRGRRGRQAVVFLTDGEDTTSRTGWDAAQRFAHTMRIPIFPIGLRVGALDFAGRKVLNRLAEQSGGEAFFPKKAEELPEVYARIAELLRSQYLLWYRSPSDKPAEQFRTVEVQVVDRPELEVRTIKGYYPGK